MGKSVTVYDSIVPSLSVPERATLILVSSSPLISVVVATGVSLTSIFTLVETLLVSPVTSVEVATTSKVFVPVVSPSID